jgi:hypothetical protein
MRRLSLLAGLGLVGLLLAERPAPAQQEWGTVKGQVVFAGKEIPAKKQLDVNKDQEHCLMNGPLFSEAWVINPKNKGVKWAFVWLAPDNPNAGPLPIHSSLKEIPKDPVVVDQPCCMFQPRASCLREGQVLIAKNSAPIAHNFKYGGSVAINPGANPLIPAKQQIEIKNLKADRLPIMVECTQHGWMKAWVRVFDHPYYAVTDENGNFEIKNAPAGTYRLLVWHEEVGYADIQQPPGGGKPIFGRQIMIKPNAANEFKVELKPQ